MNRNRKRERKGKDRRDGIWTATVPACSTAHADCWGKKKDGIWQGRGEVDWDYFPIPFVLMLGVFLCIRSFFFFQFDLVWLSL